MAGHASGWTKVGSGPLKRSVFVSKASMARAGIATAGLSGLSEAQKLDLAARSTQPGGQATNQAGQRGRLRNANGPAFGYEPGRFYRFVRDADTESKSYGYQAEINYVGEGRYRVADNGDLERMYTDGSVRKASAQEERDLDDAIRKGYVQVERTPLGGRQARDNYPTEVLHKATPAPSQERLQENLGRIAQDNPDGTEQSTILRMMDAQNRARFASTEAGLAEDATAATRLRGEARAAQREATALQGQLDTLRQQRREAPSAPAATRGEDPAIAEYTRVRARDNATVEEINRAGLAFVNAIRTAQEEGRLASAPGSYERSQELYTELFVPGRIRPVVGANGAIADRYLRAETIAAREQYDAERRRNGAGPTIAGGRASIARRAFEKLLYEDIQSALNAPAGSFQPGAPTPAPAPAAPARRTRSRKSA